MKREYREKIPYSLKFIGISGKGDEVSVYARVILNRQKTEFSIGVKGDFKGWNNELGRFDDGKSYSNYLNNRIQECEGKIFDAYISIRNSGVRATALGIKSVYKGDNAFISAPLLDKYVNNYIERIKLLPDEYSEGTIGVYKTMRKYLCLYLKYTKLTGIRIDEWKRRNFVQFEEFLQTQEFGSKKYKVGRATSNKYLAKLKAVFNYALANEDIIADPTKGFRMERVKGNREYLNSDEIHLLEVNNLAGNDSLDRVRWLFLFSIYTGLRFSDAIQLKREAVKLESDGNHYIMINQQKTKEPLYRPLLKKAVDIYEKFKTENPGSDYVLPRISNQKTNAYLKVIADLCGIRKKLSHHVARHTFATTILLDTGIDLKTTSYFMGHSSIRTTEIYGRITKNRAVEVVNELNEALS